MEASMGEKLQRVAGRAGEPTEHWATTRALDQFQHVNMYSGEPDRVRSNWLSSLNCIHIYS